MFFTIASFLGFALYCKIKKKTENVSNNFSIPDEPPSTIHVISNSAVMEFDQNIFNVIKKLENISDKNFGNLPNYDSALLNCAQIRITKNQDTESQLPPPTYFSFTLPKNNTLPPPDYYTNQFSNS
jgi:hypothetical protein